MSEFVILRIINIHQYSFILHIYAKTSNLAHFFKTIDPVSEFLLKKQAKSRIFGYFRAFFSEFLCKIVFFAYFRLLSTIPKSFRLVFSHFNAIFFVFSAFQRNYH